MATQNTPTTIASRLKQVYPNGINEVVPAKLDLIKRLKWDEELEPGKEAVFDVQLSHEGGFSFGNGAVQLNPAIAQTSETAKVTGQGIYLRSQVSYDAIEAAKKSKQAFAKFHDKKFIPMVESFRKLEEILAYDGGRGLGVVEEVNGQVITLTEASWNAYRWLGAKDRVFNAFDALSGGNQHNGDFTLASTTIAERKLTVVGTISSVTQGDILFLKGQRGNDPRGLMGIAKETSTYYNINPATHELWKANSFDVGTSALTMGKLMDAVCLSADKGCDRKLTALIPTRTFQVLVDDQAALRRYKAEKKAVNGFESISFIFGDIEVEVIPYAPCRDGEFVIFPEDITSRIGCAQAQTKVASQDGEIIFDVPDYTVKEMRMWANWTVFCDKPGYITYGTRSDAKALHA